MREIAYFNVRDRTIIDLLWSTGARISGILSMRVDRLEVWREDREYRIAAVVTSKRKTRYVYAAGDQARSVSFWLKLRPATASPALFVTGAGKPLTVSGAHAMLRKLRIKAEIPPGVPCNAHAFRHAFAIRMLDAGHDLATVAAWLGHSDPAFTAKTYAVRREDQLRSKYFGD